MTSRAVVAVTLLLLPGGAAAQRSFDFSAGAFWGGHAPDRPVAAGWAQSSRLLDQWVLEGTSRVDTAFETRGGDFDGDVRVTLEDRYETLLGRAQEPLGRGVGELLLPASGRRVSDRSHEDVRERHGGHRGREPRCGTFGGDGTFVSPCDPPFPAGETAYGFVLQPGVGVEFWGPEFDVPLISLAELGFRVAADLPILANRDHVEVRPRMAGMLVVGW